MGNKKVVIGLSGGVDSSVAAYLLKEQGYEVLGVTMQIWEDAETFRDTNGAEIAAVEDARKVAQYLDIPHYVMNFKDTFEKNVIDYFTSEYLRGRTPNPCNACNRYVKWEALLERSRQLGADAIATGHYARIRQCANGRYTLEKSVTAAKDQTYALYNLTQEQLAHTIMPVGDYEKNEIRQIAQRVGIPVAQKPDSQEICFIPDHDYAAFIEQRVGKSVPGQGNFIDKEGTILGTHRGIIHYTIGQRKGLDLSMGRPVFVTEIRPDTNEVVIGDAQDLFATEVFVPQVNFMSVPTLSEPVRAVAKIRYAHKGAACTVTQEADGVLHCSFDEPQRAVTPGQALVIYEGDHILCGGLIAKAGKSE